MEVSDFQPVPNTRDHPQEQQARNHPSCTSTVTSSWTCSSDLSKIQEDTCTRQDDHTRMHHQTVVATGHAYLKLVPRVIQFKVVPATATMARTQHIALSNCTAGWEQYSSDFSTSSRPEDPAHSRQWAGVRDTAIDGDTNRACVLGSGTESHPSEGGNNNSNVDAQPTDRTVEWTYPTSNLSQTQEITLRHSRHETILLARQTVTSSWTCFSDLMKIQEDTCTRQNDHTRMHHQTVFFNKACVLETGAESHSI